MKKAILFGSIFVAVALALVAFQLASNRGHILPPTKLLTAAEVLNEIESDWGGYYPEGNKVVALPPEELDKVVSTLRNRFPTQSLAHRLPPRANAELTSTPVKLSRSAERGLKDVERQFTSYQAKRRSDSLKKLHSSEVESFVNRKGFGFARRPPMGASPKALLLQPIEQYQLSPIKLTSDHYGSTSVKLQPGRGLDHVNGLPKSGTIELLHNTSRKLFSSGQSVGYVKDIENVAGFKPHQLEYSDKWKGSVFQAEDKVASDQWHINRIELVGMLLNDRPLVYIAQQGELPTMEDIGDRETRELSEFETRGLEAFADGHDTYISASLNRIEMMGALRAADSCLQCHDVQRGEVLGAFSYDILRAPVVKPKAQPSDDGVAFSAR